MNNFAKIFCQFIHGEKILRKNIRVVYYPKQLPMNNRTFFFNTHLILLMISDL